MSSDDLSRLTDRSRTRMIERALTTGQLPRSLERAMRREDGHSTRSTADLEFLAREPDVRLSSSADLRSELVRRLVQLEMLDANRGLVRSADDDGDDDSSEERGSGGDAPTAADKIFTLWFEEMQSQGLNKAEIEEHLVARIRAIRRGVLGQAEERRLRRK